MQPIILSNSQKRTAELLLLPMAPPKEVKRVVETGGEILEPEAQAIIARMNWVNGRMPEQIAQDLVAGNPEIDLQLIGRPIKPKCRVYVDQDQQVNRSFKLVEERLTPKGEVKEKRPYRVADANLQHPILYSGKFVPIAEAVQKYVFHRAYQIVHRDGLTYDFIMALAQEIGPDRLLLIRGGLKGNEPLVLTRGGLPSQGFLRARVHGNRYQCLLYLTYQELKLPAA